MTTIYAGMAGGTIVEISTAELQVRDNAATAKRMVHWKQKGGRWPWDKDVWNMNCCRSTYPNAVQHRSWTR